MQEFFIDYGLWLLIALLIIIGIVFLLSGRQKADQADDAASAGPVEQKPASLASTPPPPAPKAVAVPVPMVPVDVEAIVPAVPETEPVTAPVEAPPVVPVSPAVTAPSEGPDDLLKLKGVGPKLNMLLIELGVTRFAQIAAWTDADLAAIDAKLGNFKGRPVRDQWIDQAKYLAAGDVAGFEAKYGKI